MNQWVLVRVAFLVLSLFAAPSFLSMEGEFSHPAFLFFFEIAGFCLLGVCFVVSIQKINPLLSSAEWIAPSWSRNPFSLREPLQLFDFAASNLVAVGIACLLIGMIRSPQNWAWELPLAAGVGSWIGVRLCVSKQVR